MNTSQSVHNPLPPSPPVDQSEVLDNNLPDQLSELRRQLRKYLGIETFLQLLSVVIIVFWLTMAIDYLPVRLAGADETPVIVRGILLVLTGTIVGWIGYWQYLRPRMRPLPDREMAMVLERRFPTLAESLITSVESQTTTPRSACTAAMLQRATLAASQELRHLSVKDVLDFRPLHRTAWITSILGGSIILFAVVAISSFQRACARFYLLSDQPWPRETQLEAVGFRDKQLKVTRGDDLVLQVRANAALRVPPPEICYVYYQTADGDRGRAAMTKAGTVVDGYQYYQYADRPFRGILSDVNLSVVGNDFRLKNHRIVALDSPTFSQPELTITPPSYTGLTVRKEVPRDGLRVPQGSRVSFTATTSRPIQSLKVWQGRERTETTITNLAPHEFRYDVGLVSEEKLLEFQLTDIDGLRSSEPYRIAITVIRDEAPVLNVAFRGIGTAVTPIARLPVDGIIVDDYGLTQVELEVVLSDTASNEQSASSTTSFRWDGGLPHQGTWAHELDLRQPPATWANPLLQPGQTITLTVHASDNCDLVSQRGASHVSLAPLSIVSREELLAIIEGRELGLRRRFEQMVQEMEEARDALVRLKADLSDTDTPSTDWSEVQDIRIRRNDAHAKRAQPELDGMAASYSDIWLELQNNRVNTPEIEERIADHLVKPLEEIAQRTFPEYQQGLRQLQDGLSDTKNIDQQLVQASCTRTIERSDSVLVAMREVLSRMLQLEDFNELIELVRQMLQQQETLLQETEKLRNDSLRNLLEE